MRARRLAMSSRRRASSAAGAAAPLGLLLLLLLFIATHEMNEMKMCDIYDICIVVPFVGCHYTNVLHLIYFKTTRNR